MEDTGSSAVVVAHHNKKPQHPSDNTTDQFTTTSSSSLVTDLKGHKIETSVKQFVELPMDDRLDGQEASDASSSPTTTEMTTNRTMQIELEQNLLSISSLVNRDKSSVEDV